MYNTLITYLKKDIAITLYSSAIVCGIFSLYLEQSTNPAFNIFILILLTIFLFSAFAIDIEKLFDKVKKWQDNKLLQITIIFIKYISFIIVSLLVIKTVNTSIYDLLGENPKNYPATLASLTILISPIIWVGLIIGLATIIGVLLATFLPLILSFISFFKRDFSIFPFIVRIISFAIIIGFTQGAFNILTKQYDKLLIEAIIETAFYKNNDHCNNINNDALIAFTDKSDEIMLFNSVANNRINFTKVECVK